jgi:acetylornithine deacetylase/succinyl-diaminopimelate desuccinylase-like protein
MSRTDAIARAQQYYDSGALFQDIARRVALPTESQNPARAGELHHYLDQEIRTTLEAMGFECRLLEHPRAKGPFLFAQRIEDPALPTVFSYGHGDVVLGMEGKWRDELSPWTLTRKGNRWYGRGVVDNKGQHSINMAALKCVLETRGKLGFNVKYLVEMGEEMGSPGLRDVCEQYRDLLRGDVLIASDGPRLLADRPTLFLGSRGQINVDLKIEAREGGHHSGNWGGLLSNPAIQLANALATIVSSTGKILVREWMPPELPASVRRALEDCSLDAADGPAIDPNWGEPGLSAAEKVYGWSSAEILAFVSGNPDKPVHAIPPRAWARMQLRYVVGVDPDDVIPSLRRHLDRLGYTMIELSSPRDEVAPATRLDPEHPWVRWAAESIQTTTGKKPAILPNLGGTLPNHVFSDTLGMPTLWVPHSYAGCSQHAPNEHLPEEIAREGMAIMAGLYWDMGERSKQ